MILFLVIVIIALSVIMNFKTGNGAGIKLRDRLFFDAYNMLTGLGFFIIEGLLFLVYQSIFLTASSSLIFVFGMLLFSSGVGGLFCDKISLKKSTGLLIGSIFLAVYGPGLLIDSGVSFASVKLLGLLFICLTGILMGIYFPKGLNLAKRYGLKKRVPHLFAVNAFGGALALLLSLWMGIRWGYFLTTLFAILLYMAAGIIFNQLRDRAPR